MDDIGPRGSSKLLWQPPRTFFSVRMSNKHGLCRADRVLAASWRLPGCPWRPLDAFCGCLGAPGAPWRLLAAACVDSFWRPWALLGLLGSLCSILFLAGLGGLFHRFGRCPHQDDFLEEFVFQSAPKLVLVTLAPFGPPGGGSGRLCKDSKFSLSLRSHSAFWLWEALQR